MSFVGIVGYYGYQNYGDELFLNVWRSKLSNENTVVVCANDDLSKIDKIIIGGGDLIWNFGFNNNYFNFEWFEKNKKIIVYGVGVASPNVEIKDKNIWQLYQNFLSAASYISTRDPNSWHWLKNFLEIETAELVPDLVWSYKPKVFKEKKPLVVGISYRKNPWFNIEDMTKICLRLLDFGYELKFIPLQDGYNSTREFHKIIIENITRFSNYPSVNIIPENLDVDHKYAEIASCGFYLTIAFHGVITALKEKVPFLSLINSNKAVEVLKDVGMEWTLCKRTQDVYCMLKRKGDVGDSLEKTLFHDYVFSDDKINWLKNNSDKCLEKLIEKFELVEKLKQ